MTSVPRFGFVTCVQLGLACMETIYRIGGTLDLVLTLPDDVAAKKSGRVYVDGFCRERGIPLVHTRNVNDDMAVAAVRKHEIDWLLIIGWSQIARHQILDAPALGVIGMHPTRLPEGRGRAAIPWAILKGLSVTGVTMFKMDAGVDTGPIIAQLPVPIATEETASTLYDKVASAHALLIERTWEHLVAGRVQLRPQSEAGASTWPGRRPEDGEIAPHMTVLEAERLVRATTRPYPGAFWRDGSRVIRIWRAAIATSASALPGAPRIPLSNGAIDALEFDIEP